MRNGWPWRRRIFRLLLRGVLCGIALALLALAWNSGRAPAIPIARASGIPYCPNPMPDEHAPTRPALHLNRAEGPAGTQLTFTATGWRPGAHVTLHFDGRDPKTGKLHILIPDFARGSVANNGTITLSSLQAPSFLCMDMVSHPNVQYLYGDAAGGATGYFVVTSDDGSVSAPLAFRYLPAPRAKISGLDAYGSALVGSDITVSGTGWEPYEVITLSLVDTQTHAPLPYTIPAYLAADADGAFTASYLLGSQLHWNTDVLLAAAGAGPRFGALTEYANLSLLPALEPTFRVDHRVVTPGMAITVSGEYWYPGTTYTIKYCDAQWWRDGWVEGGNCGKSSNPALGNVTADAQGWLRQTFTIPANQPPGVVMVRVNDLLPWMNVPVITVQIVDHLPTWDEIHPRVAALRNAVVCSLPFTIPAAALLGTLVFVGIRRRRGQRAAH